MPGKILTLSQAVTPVCMHCLHWERCFPEMRPRCYSIKSFVLLVKRCVPFSTAVCACLFAHGQWIKVKGKVKGGLLEHTNHLIIN